jgi:hypothetical protein
MFTCCSDREFNRCITGTDTTHTTPKPYRLNSMLYVFTCGNKVYCLTCGRLRAEAPDDQGWFKGTGLTPKATKLGKVSKQDELARSHLAKIARDGNWGELPCFKCGELCTSKAAFGQNKCFRRKIPMGKQCFGRFVDNQVTSRDKQSATFLVNWSI